MSFRIKIKSQPTAGSEWYQRTNTFFNYPKISNDPGMGMSCNGVCHRYKATKPLGASRYLAGQKRCNFCDVYILWEGLFCPCCNLRLRLAPRSGKYKKKFLDELEERKRELIVTSSKSN